MDPLFVFEGYFNGVPVDVLKDDGCNTNILSRTIVNRFKKCFDLKWSNMELSFAKKGFMEKTTHIIVKGTVKIGSHRYHIQLGCIRLQQ